MSRKRPGLMALQAAMMDALHDTAKAESLTGSIRAAAGRRALDALSIYRRSMRATLANTLRLSYPTVEQRVGKDFFAAAAHSFVRITPSHHGDLDCYGADFADFLATLPSSIELPWLSDLARLEWLIHELHRSAQEPALTRGELAGMDIPALADRPLRLGRRVALFESRWPVARIWLAHRNPAEDPDFAGVETGPDRALIAALDPTRIISLDPAAWTFFKSLAANDSLLAAVDKACAIDAAFDFQSVFGAALDCGALCAFPR